VDVVKKKQKFMDELSNIFLNPKILHLTKNAHTISLFINYTEKKEEDNK